MVQGKNRFGLEITMVLTFWLCLGISQQARFGETREEKTERICCSASVEKEARPGQWGLHWGIEEKNKIFYSSTIGRDSDYYPREASEYYRWQTWLNLDKST